MEGKHRVMVFALCLAVFNAMDASTVQQQSNTSLSPTSSTKTSETTPTNTSGITPTNTSEITPTNTAETTPTNTSETTPTNTSGITSTNTSEITPTNTSEITPTNTSGITSTNTSEITPTNTSEITPTKTSETTSTNTSETTPTNTSGITPTNTSEITPTNTAETTPTNTSETTPTKTSETSHTNTSKTVTNVSTIKSTSTTTPTTKYPSHVPDRTNLSIPLAIVVKANFSPELSNKSSLIYKKYYNAFNQSLTDFYQNMTGFISVDIAGFVNGSIRCNFNLNVETTPSSNVQDINNTLRKKEYGSLPVEVDKTPLKIDDNKTRTAMEHAITEAFREPCRSFHVECSDDTFCEVDTGKFMCSHKCNTNNICSNNGECFVDTRGTVKCRCREDSMYVYKGDTCKEKVMVFFSGKNTAIIGGSAGAVIACLLLLLIFLGARWKQKQRIVKSPDEKLSDPEEIRRDNLQIENVPMDGFGKTNPMFRPDNSDHHDEGHDYSNHGNRANRENVYEDELAYNEGRYYRVLKDPESRTQAYVYQPSNMSIPEQRTSTASKFDELDYKPLSHHLRPEKEHQSFHDMVDTEQPYSIRRPQIMRTTVNSNGYR